MSIAISLYLRVSPIILISSNLTGIILLLGGYLIIGCYSYITIDFLIGKAISCRISVANTGDGIFIYFDLDVASNYYD